MPARLRASEQRQQYTTWDRARLSVVVPIGVIVAVAIVCIVVAVLSSAKRADEVAAAREKNLLAHALESFGGGVLREVESVASSQGTVRNIRLNFDAAWADRNVGLWLRNNFEHDEVFVFDGADRPIYSLAVGMPPDPAWLAVLVPDMQAVLDYMRGRAPLLKNAAALIGKADSASARTHARRWSTACAAVRPSSRRQRSVPSPAFRPCAIRRRRC